MPMAEGFCAICLLFRHPLRARPGRKNIADRSVPGDHRGGGEALPVGRLAFKAREGRQTALSGFDSHSLPPFPVQRRPATSKKCSFCMNI